MNFEEVDRILTEGTPEEIRSLSGQDIEYGYAEKSGGFCMRAGEEGYSSHGLFEVPACVAVFGPSHNFAKSG